MTLTPGYGSAGRRSGTDRIGQDGTDGAAEERAAACRGTAGGQCTSSGTLAQIRLSVGDGQSTPTFKAGEQTDLTINVMNKGNLDAQNVQITPVVENVSDWPFDMSKLNYDRSLGTIKAGEQASAVWGSEEEGLLTVREDVTGTVL